MSLINYCKRCLYPDTKPDLYINDQGVCSACIAFDERKNINWSVRENQFKEMCDLLKVQSHQYHCVIPVSGGKDSTYQVIKALEYGLRPLAVTATTDHLSSIGRANLDNISRLGVDHVEITTNAKLRRQINKYTLKEIGDISWAEHVTIFSLPIRIALEKQIPLILYGENPQNEYGGPTEETQKAVELDERWLQEFGGLNGLRVSDIISQGLATIEQMYLYTYPKYDFPNQHNKTYVTWLGQYFQWDGAENAKIASQHGFKCWYGAVEGTGYGYENLDNLQTGIHDYYKWIKFGFGRCTDLVCNHIRRGSITRKEGKEIILSFDGAWPSTYLGVSLEEILSNIDMTIDEFILNCNSFTNTRLFKIIKSKPRPIPLYLDDLKNA